jgi:hypothetical protein
MIRALTFHHVSSVRPVEHGPDLGNRQRTVRLKSRAAPLPMSKKLAERLVFGQRDQRSGNGHRLSNRRENRFDPAVDALEPFDEAERGVARFLGDAQQLRTGPGASGWLVKPVDGAALLSVLGQLCPAVRGEAASAVRKPRAVPDVESTNISLRSFRRSHLGLRCAFALRLLLLMLTQGRLGVAAPQTEWTLRSAAKTRDHTCCRSRRLWNELVLRVVLILSRFVECAPAVADTQRLTSLCGPFTITLPQAFTRLDTT